MSYMFIEHNICPEEPKMTQKTA
uniref:Uncharacterized protein n=1 Tax=Anguilla anguilla TaxID=7936 RepID=A0A0E9XDD5_ANGAN